MKFDFDEGRFDDPDDDDDDDDDDPRDEGGGSSSKSDGIIQNKAVQGGGGACISDYWERHDEDSAWYRSHVEVRKKLFGTTNEDLPPGGPSHEELDTVRATHMRVLPSVALRPEHVGEDRNLHHAAGRDRKPVRRQPRPEGRQERSSASVPERAASALSSRSPRRTPSMWSCATQGAIAPCSISTPPLYGLCTSSSLRTTWGR